MESKYVMILILLLSPFLFVKDAYADSTRVYVSSTSSVKVNETFNVYVMIENVVGLYGYEFKLLFDNSILNCLSLQKGSFFPEENIYIGASEINNSLGYIYYVITLTNPITEGISGNGILLTVQFKALNTGYSFLNLTDTVLGDSNAQEISHTIGNGYVNVNKSSEEGGLPPSNITDSVYVDILNFSSVLNSFSFSYDVKFTLYVQNLRNYAQNVSLVCELYLDNSLLKNESLNVDLDSYEIKNVVVNYRLSEGAYTFIVSYGDKSVSKSFYLENILKSIISAYLEYIIIGVIAIIVIVALIIWGRR